ncbi:MAG: hypothetical protein ABIH42_04880, partial [Planctomycetota bacterium]
FDFYYTGVSVGWVWGYNTSYSHHNSVCFNKIYSIGHGVLSDMGGVYTLGVSPGTVVSNNVIHDVRSTKYGGWGLYTDEGSTGIVMENNLVYNTETGSFHQHYGRENIIRNNIFVSSNQWQIQYTRPEPHLSFTFERNIVYWNSGPLLMGNWLYGKVEMNNNLYYRTSGSSEPFRFAGLPLKDWQALGRDTDSIIADPGFVDAKNFNFELKDDSPAFKIGFKKFDFAKAGRRKSESVIPEIPTVPVAYTKSEPNLYDEIDLLFNKSILSLTDHQYQDAIDGFIKIINKAQNTDIAVISMYNIACAYALMGKTDEAFNWLEESIKGGYKDLEHMEKDSDIALLRKDEERWNKIKEMCK